MTNEWLRRISQLNPKKNQRMAEYKPPLDWNDHAGWEAWYRPWVEEDPLGIREQVHPFESAVLPPIASRGLSVSGVPTAGTTSGPQVAEWTRLVDCWPISE